MADESDEMLVVWLRVDPFIIRETTKAKVAVNHHTTGLKLIHE
jgi:hypothetical protein